MATLTVEITDELKKRLDREVAAGHFKDNSALVQTLLEAAIRIKWKEEVDKKIDEALDEVERGEVLPWNMGDCASMGREYLEQRRNRKASS